MLELLRDRRRSSPSAPRQRAVRPTLEGLEDRLLLFATNGGLWTYGSRVTYSFVPDGTNNGGTPTNLFSTLNASYTTATWQAAFQAAAAYWEASANINLSLVSDNGAPIASSGNQQGDPNFGDIRISMNALPQGQLAYAFLPPPLNGGPAAGDITFSSSVSWAPNSGYDLETVALHEMGHALGLDHSPTSTDVLYAYYNGTNQYLSTDDVAGVTSIYGAVPADTDNARYFTTAKNLNGLIDSNLQIAIPRTINASASDTRFYSVTVPSGTTGTMTVSLQSTNLSSFSPKLLVMNAARTVIGNVNLPNSYGATATVTINGVTPGQLYYFRTSAASSGGGYVGAYGLLVNFGSAAQAPIAPPNTVVAQQASQGGGSLNELAGSTLLSNGLSFTLGAATAIMDMVGIKLPDGLTGYAEALMATPEAAARAAAHPIGPVSVAQWFGATGEKTKTVVVTLSTTDSTGVAATPTVATPPVIAPWTGVDPMARDAAFARFDAAELSLSPGNTPWAIRNRHRHGV